MRSHSAGRSAAQAISWIWWKIISGKTIRPRAWPANSTLLAGVGIGDLPPLVQPDLIRNGRLIEIMSGWQFRTFDLSMVHPANRHTSRPVRVFKEFAAQMARTRPPLHPRDSQDGLRSSRISHPCQTPPKHSRREL
jgi:DNA-binding transcriptional LysR family regulator